MTPIPTPYDITPIPYIPYAPGLSDWIALAIILAAGGVGIVRFTRYQMTRSASPLESACAELARLDGTVVGPSLSRGACFSASQITKRAIDAAFGTNLHAASLSELQTLAASHPSDILREIVEILAGWDIAKFGRSNETTVPRDQVRTVRMLLVTLRHRGIAPLGERASEGASDDP